MQKAVVGDSCVPGDYSAPRSSSKWASGKSESTLSFSSAEADADTPTSFAGTSPSKRRMNEGPRSTSPGYIDGPKNPAKAELTRSATGGNRSCSESRSHLSRQVSLFQQFKSYRRRFGARQRDIPARSALSGRNKNQRRRRSQSSRTMADRPRLSRNEYLRRRVAGPQINAGSPLPRLERDSRQQGRRRRLEERFAELFCRLSLIEQATVFGGRL
jgi:hypothetical protein